MSMIVGRLFLGTRLHEWWRPPVSRPNHEWLFLVLGIFSAVRSAVESFPSCTNCIPRTRTLERREDSINWFTCLIKFNSCTSNWSRETFSFSPVRACWRRWCISFSTRRSVSIDVLDDREMVRRTFERRQTNFSVSNLARSRLNEPLVSFRACFSRLISLILEEEINTRSSQSVSSYFASSWLIVSLNMTFSFSNDCNWCSFSSLWFTSV